MNKSFSEYCMRKLALKTSKNNQQSLKRRRRFLNGTVQQNENVKNNQNGNEADDEEKFDEPEATKVTEKEVDLVIDPKVTECITPLLDEMLTSTVNTDVSWDGYTDSPFYSNSATAEDLCVGKKAQPILPWDELFFELEPFDEMTHNVSVTAVL